LRRGIDRDNKAPHDGAAIYVSCNGNIQHSKESVERLMKGEGGYVKYDIFIVR
jgi:hypothetical protein